MAEGMAPSAVNDTSRTRMAAHRAQWEDAEWFDWGHVPAYVSASTFTVSNSVTLIYSLGRRLKLYDGSLGAQEIRYGHVITISAVSATNTKFTVSLTSGNLTSSLSSVAVAILDPTNTSIPKGAVLDTPTINVGLAGTALADQTAMEAASNGTLIVSPQKVQYHPGVAKAWVVFDGTAGSPSAAAGHNISSITKNGTGDYTITFTTAFSSADFVGAVTASLNGGTPHEQIAYTGAAASSSTYRIGVYNSNANTAADAQYVQAVFFGDQA
jgi:hypothetical protein